MVDSETEETVHVITFPSTTAAAGYLDGLSHSASISKQVVYVKDGVQGLDVYDAPWDDAPLLGPVPGGFAAFESIEYPAGTLQGFPVTWRSTDGYNWTETGSPDFLPERYENITVFPLNGTLVARVVAAADQRYGRLRVGRWVQRTALKLTDDSSEGLHSDRRCEGHCGDVRKDVRP